MMANNIISVRPKKNWFGSHVIPSGAVVLCTILLLIIVVSKEKNVSWTVLIASISISLITSLTFSYTLNHLQISSVHTDKRETMDHMHDIGLQAIHLSVKSNDSDAFFSNIERATSIDMMYNTGRFVSLFFGERIVEAVCRNKCRVRIILSDPQSIVWQSRILKESLSPDTNVQEEIAATLTKLRELIEQANQEAEYTTKSIGHLEVRLSQSILTASMIIRDRALARITPYLPHLDNLDGPTYDVNNYGDGKLIQIYQEVFEAVWEHAGRMEITFPE